MEDGFFEGSSLDYRSATRLVRMPRHELLEVFRISMACRMTKAPVLGTIDEGSFGAAEPCGGFDQRVEYGLQIECRTADDLEHVGRRGLPLQRFAEVGRALAQFVEQPRVLDGDDGLSSEVRKHCDLLVC